MPHPQQAYGALYDAGGRAAPLFAEEEGEGAMSAREGEERGGREGGRRAEGGRIDREVVEELVTHLLSPTPPHKPSPSTRCLVSPDLIVSLPLFPQPEPAFHTHDSAAAAASQRALALFRLPTLAVSLLPFASWTPRVFRVEETTLAVAAPEHHHHHHHRGGDKKGKGKARAEEEEKEELEHVDVVEKWSAAVEWTLAVSSPFGRGSRKDKGGAPWVETTTAPRKVDLVFTSRGAPSRPRSKERRRRPGPPYVVREYDDQSSSSSEGGGGEEVGATTTPRLVEKVSAEEHALELSFFRYSLPPSPFPSLLGARDAALALLALLERWVLPLIWALLRLVGLDARLSVDSAAGPAPGGQKRRARESIRGPSKRRKHLASQLASTGVPGEGETLAALVGGEPAPPSGEGHLRRHRRWSASTSSTASSATLTPASPPAAHAPLPASNPVLALVAGVLDVGRALLATLRRAVRDVGDLLWTIRQGVLFVAELGMEGWGVAKEVLLGGEGRSGAKEEESEGSEERSSGGKSPKSAMSGGNGSRTYPALHKRVSFSSSSQVITASPPTTSGTATPIAASFALIEQSAGAVAAHALVAAQAAAQGRERGPERAWAYDATHGVPPEARSPERRTVAHQAAYVAREVAPLFAPKYSVAAPDAALVGPGLRAAKSAAAKGRRLSGSEEELRAVAQLDDELEAKRAAALASVHPRAPAPESEADEAHRAAARAAADQGRRMSGSQAELAALAGVDYAQAARTRETWLRLQDEAAASRGAPAAPARHLHPASAVPHHLGGGAGAGSDGGSETPTVPGSSGRLSPFSGLAATSTLGEAEHAHGAGLAEKLHALAPDQLSEPGGGGEKKQERETQQEQEVAGSTTDTSASAPPLEAKVRYASAREAAGGTRPPISAPQKLDIEQVPTPPGSTAPPVPGAPRPAVSSRSRLPPSVLAREKERMQAQKQEEGQAQGREGAKSWEGTEREEAGSDEREAGKTDVPQEHPEFGAGVQSTPSRESDVSAYYTPESGSPEQSLRPSTGQAPRTPSPGAHSPLLHHLGAQSVFAPVFRPAAAEGGQERAPLQPVQAAGLVGAGSSPESSPSSSTAAGALPLEERDEPEAGPAGTEAVAGAAGAKKRRREKGDSIPAAPRQS